MNLYRSLLISTIIIILVVSTRQQQQACPEGGAFVQDIHSGILELPYNDLNEGTINKNYFEPISEGILNKNKRMALAFCNHFYYHSHGFFRRFGPSVILRINAETAQFIKLKYTSEHNNGFSVPKFQHAFHLDSNSFVVFNCV